jgi:ADP-heptose:LPS heptosyltransferase
VVFEEVPLNILVVRTDKLGDFITALPTFYALKHYNPSNKIIALVAPLNRDLAEYCDFIDEVIVDRGQPLFTLVDELRSTQIDASVTLFSNTRVAVAQWLAGIKIRVAPATKLAQVFYNRRITQRRSQVKMPEYAYNLELARALFPELNTTYPQPLLRFTSDELAATKQAFFTSHGVARPVVAFHPGFGGSSDANWTLDEYIELVALAVKHHHIQVVMTFGPDEEELRHQAMLKAAGLDVIFYQSTQGIVAFAKLLASFKLFVSTSTGTYHLAALVGTPTMTFFADSLFASVKRWKAVSEGQKQHPYMLPADETERSVMFAEVKRDLQQQLSAL